MRKLLFTLFSLLIVSVSVTAGTAEISGKWLMTKVNNGKKAQEVYQVLDFRNDGYAEMQGRVFGSWNFDNKSNTITMKSDMIKEFDGTWEILELSGTQLVLKANTHTMYFEKYAPEKTEQINRDSGLSGVWKLKEKDEDNSDIYLNFLLPNEIKVKYISPGSSGTGSGMWFADGKNKTVVLTVRNRLLRGMNRIISITKNNFKLEKNGISITGQRLVQNALEREKLEFTEDEIYDAAVYLDSDKFPWFNYEESILYKKNIRQLNYKKSTLISGLDVFAEENLSANVSFDEEYGEITVDEIFGRLSADQGGGENIFYPLSEPDIYTVAGEKEITVPAGTFVCTVIEAADSFEGIKTRYYMINNRPGVYARIIIISKIFDDETYTMYELTDIVENSRL